MFTKEKIKTTDLRVQKTKKLIRDSFFELVEEKGYSKVTVMDITKKAMINRNTFYLHYVDKEDLIDQILTENLKSHEDFIKDLYNVMSLSSCIFSIIFYNSLFFILLLYHKNNKKSIVFFIFFLIF